MKKLIFAFIATLLASAALPAAETPLRVFIRGGAKSHGTGAHEHSQFLNDWVKLLNERGAKAEGAEAFPTDAQLEATDVLVMYAQNGGTIPVDRRDALDRFLKRGGGLTVIHTAAVSDDPAHWKTIIGGAWIEGKTRWLEGPMSLYYSDTAHPISREASNYDVDDEIYYDMDLSPEINVLAAAYTPKSQSGEVPADAIKVSVYDIQPQIWTYEKDNYRAFVHLPGHLYKNFSLPQMRAVLLRGIAWSGKRENVDMFCKPDELASLRYPVGGPALPEKSLSETVVHPEFEMKLIASEPLINKPINFDWDTGGRLWVAETQEYPNGRREPKGEAWKDSGSRFAKIDRPATDRVSILTDSNNDGVMDQKSVFVDGLELITGFVFYKDGIIVTQAPDILYIRDTDGDGKADTTTKLYTGLGDRDTHAVINNPRWGFDGWIYATHGYSSGEVKSPDGSKSFGLIGSGVVRFKPDGSMIEQYSSKGGNTWGLDISWDNEIFYTQPTSGEVLMHVVLPEYVLARGKIGKTASYKSMIIRRPSFPLIDYKQLPYVQIDLVGSFTAAAGCAIYDGGTWPKEWNNSYFTTEPTINIVHHEMLKPVGPSYTADKTREPEFIASKDYWYRPIETRIGPDGALFVGDFYNQAVIHNDTRGPVHGNAHAAVRPDRDHYFGRIWRVDHKQAETRPAPNFSKADATGLVAALKHPNRPVRVTAMRKIIDLNDEKAVPALAALLAPSEAAYTRIASLWALHLTGHLTTEQLKTGLLDQDSAVKKNAAEVAELTPQANLQKELVAVLSDKNPRARIAALKALAVLDSTAETASGVLSAYTGLDDDWSKSAALGVALHQPDVFITAAFKTTNPSSFGPLVEQLAAVVASKNDLNVATKLIVEIAAQPAESDSLKQIVLEQFTRAFSTETQPVFDAPLKSAFTKLLENPNSSVAGAALPLVVRWDQKGELKSQTGSITDQLITHLNDRKLDEKLRAQAARNLLAIRASNRSAFDAVTGLLISDDADSIKQKIITALAETDDAAVAPALIRAYGSLTQPTQALAFDALMKRSEWTQKLIDALRSKEIQFNVLGPANASRLRRHPDPAISKSAIAAIEELRGPQTQQKQQIIAKLLPEVTQPGNAETGKQLFTAACATCHQFNDGGKNIGPSLTGMGAHGAAELLVHIIDPNREVDPTFQAWNFEMNDGTFHAGVIARENNATVLLRSLAGEEDLKKSEIKSRVNTGLSLMPEGFEGLGGEGLRDLLTYMTAGNDRFRFIDLSKAFTADSRVGLFSSKDSPDTIDFVKTGPVEVEGVPFNIVAADRTDNGKNVMVLKGNAPSSEGGKQPQQVEVNVGYAMKELHFLGGIGGWAWPFGGDKTKGLPVLKVTVHYADGKTEEFQFNNGVEFSDHIRENPVPGSKLAKGMVKKRQLRWFSRELSENKVVEKLTFTSAGNNIVPVIVAVTADLKGGIAAKESSK